MLIVIICTTYEYMINILTQRLTCKPFSSGELMKRTGIHVKFHINIIKDIQYGFRTYIYIIWSHQNGCVRITASIH